MTGLRPEEMVDVDRYPVTSPASPGARSTVRQLRESLAKTGVATLSHFLRPESVAAIARETEALLPTAHYENVSVGTPYLELADTSFPEGHPRCTDIHSATWVLAYDLIPRSSVLRALYEWDALMDFIGEILDRRPLHRFADPMGALNLAVMNEGDVQGWHFDSTDFVVSLAIQSSTAGGLFECAPFIRSSDDENYDEVARVIRGEGADRLEILPMTPGTLMIFHGRHSLHRVTPVEGDTPRYVALLAYDTEPGTASSDLLKVVRYGRTEPVEPPP